VFGFGKLFHAQGKARWLTQWFGLEIDADTQRVLRVPRDPLGNVPDMTTLPLMLMSLCYDVDWGMLIDAAESDEAQGTVMYACASLALAPWYSLLLAALSSV
jgi:hypothetical protein